MAQAETCFKRALELNPGLAIAHSLYAQLEVDLGRAKDAMIRLLEWTKKRSADPQVFAGLVHACRYCGLLEASVAAHEQAQRLDPHVPTSVLHTFWAMGEYARGLEVAKGTTDSVTALFFLSMGRKEEAIATLRMDEERFVHTNLRLITGALLALAEGNREKCVRTAEQLAALKTPDPERRFYTAVILAAVGETATALSVLNRALDEGFACFPALARTPWLDSLRAEPLFMAMLHKVEQRHRDAFAAFLQAGGDQVVGIALGR
jgi:tetratricopeptide (TPR) repeat protein